MIEKAIEITEINNSLDPNSPLIPRLGELVLLKDKGTSAAAKLKETNQGLDEELDAVKQRWRNAIRQAEKYDINVQKSIVKKREEISDFIIEGIEAGSVAADDIIYTYGLLSGPKASGYLYENYSFDFEQANEDLERFRSLKPEEPIVYHISSVGKNNIISGFITDDPSVELDEDYYPIDPIVTIPITNDTEVKGSWGVLNQSIIVGHKEVDKYLSDWAKANFIPKKSYKTSGDILRILHELAGLQPLGINNEKIQLIQQRVLARVNDSVKDSIGSGTSWRIALSNSLRDIRTVYGEEKFDEVARLVSPKLPTGERIELFTLILNPNKEELAPAEQYAVKYKAAKLAEKYSQ